MERIDVEKMNKMLKTLAAYPDLNPILRLPDGRKIDTDVQTVTNEITEYIVNQDITGYCHTVATEIDLVKNKIVILVMPIVESG